jgi:hypothetical protein
MPLALQAEAVSVCSVLCADGRGVCLLQVGGIGGPVGQLLDQNQRILLQFKDNMRLYKVRA